MCKKNPISDDNVYKLRVVKAQCQERMKTLKCKMNVNIPLQEIQQKDKEIWWIENIVTQMNKLALSLTCHDT